MTKVARFPLERIVESVQNDSRLEFLFDVCDGLPRVRQKRLILRACSPEVRFLGDTALGLREA